MKTGSKPVQGLRLVNLPQRVESDRTGRNQHPAETSGLRAAVGILVLVAILLWTLWLFADLLSRVVQ
ncbi:MAG: hypothetical protein ACOX1P_22185 [Thermoguttaceae bacterium]|jgi:hypothetical protein